MAKLTNTVQEVKAQIEEMKNKKAADLEAVREKITEAKAQLEEAEKEIRTATEEMDLQRYEDAKEARRRAHSAIDMYTGRYKQLECLEFVTEEKSDETIDKLLSWEAERTNSFKEELAEIIGQAKTLLEAYFADIRDAETVIRTWESEIHANYRSATTTYADGSHRAPSPVLVHSLPYRGDDIAIITEEYINKLEKRG